MLKQGPAGKDYKAVFHLIYKMSKKVKFVVGIAVVLVFIIIQFFQPELNKSNIVENHIITKENLPENIRTLLSNSCFDCHSDNTRYPWFDRIAPVSWMVAGHIRSAKQKLDFSDWGNLDATEKVGALANIQEELKSGKMPLRSYTFIHRKTKLSVQQIKEMINWTDEFSKLIMAADTVQ
jgi:hypothetical protein